MGGTKIKGTDVRTTAVTETLIDKIPPQNIEAERAVLGSMLLEEEAVADVLDLINADSFYNESHRKIFHAVLALYNESKPVDLITLSEELRRRGELETIGGAGYLTELTNVVPTAANVLHHAKLVKEKSIVRNLITTLN